MFAAAVVVAALMSSRGCLATPDITQGMMTSPKHEVDAASVDIVLFDFGINRLINFNKNAFLKVRIGFC